MSAPNPLVAGAHSSTTGTTGLAVAEDAKGLHDGVASGSWVETGLSGAATAADAVAMATNPIAALAAHGLSWLIEHVQPLQDAMDWVAGDPDQITAYSQTWKNVAQAVSEAAQDFQSAVDKDTAHWTGPAADAYRKHAHDKVATLRAASTAATTISSTVEMIGQAVATVRQIVRDVVTQAVGEIIQIGIEEIASLGLATPIVIAQVATQVARWTAKISSTISKLTHCLTRLRPLMTRLEDVWSSIRKALGEVHGPKAASTTPAGSGAARGGVESAHGTHPSSAHADGSGHTTPDPLARSHDGNLRGKSGDPETPARNAPNRECRDDPIDIATGEMILPQTDVELDGVLPLVLGRTHLSSYRVGLSFGDSWASTVDQRLEVGSAGVSFAAEDGKLLFSPAPAPNESLRFPGSRVEIARDEAGGYTVVEAGRTLHFRGTSVLGLSAITDRNGNRVDIDRDDFGTPVEIRHSGGYRVRVESENGLITALHLRDDDRDIPLVHYEYAHRRLTAVINASGVPLRFDYDQHGRITTWTDRNGCWYRYTYDHFGRCLRTEGAGGFLSGTFEYDAANRITRHTNSLGNTTAFHLNEARQVVREVGPTGAETVSAWNECDELLSRTDPLGRTTRYDHDEAGNLVVASRPDGSQTRFEHNELNQPVTVIAPDGAISRREYDGSGNLSAVIDPLGAVTRFAYDENGNLARTTDPAGTTRRITTGAAGLAVAVSDGSGATTHFERDAFGRVTAMTDPAGAVTRFGWTVDGKPAWRTQPDGATERWLYDGEGNLRTHVDPLGRTTRTEITHFDLPSAEVRSDGSRLEFAYDTELRLVGVTNEQGLVWRYDYDPAGNLVAETDFNGRTVGYRHDEAGQLVQRTNGSGQTTTFVRNTVGEVVERRTPDGVARFDYDEAGQLTTAADEDTRVTFDRDPLGRVLAETVNGRSVSSAYDRLGRRIRRTTPSGAESSWEYDADDRPTVLRAGEHSMRFSYDVAGQEIRRALGAAVLDQAWDSNHRLLSQTVSGDGRQVQERTYSYRGDGFLTGVRDQLTGPRHFQLDQGRRVTGVQGPGWSERYAYDAAGNVSAADWTASDSDARGPREYSGTLVQRAGNVRYEYDAQGRVVLRQRTRLSRRPETWRYTWDSDDRLTGVITPDGTHWRYRYDPLGRRIAKERLSSGGHVLERVDFAWDGVVLAEQAHTDRTGPAPRPAVTTWDYEPGTFRPLAQRERAPLRDAPQEWVDERFHSIVTDLVGSPSELIDDNGRVAWHQRTTLWGNTTVDHSSTGAGTPLRFPGQYHDPESGLHYNLHRHYDPDTGRYTSPDPLGLAAGPNPHRYVANPHELIDPLGLAPCDPERFYRGMSEGEYKNQLQATGKLYPKFGETFVTQDVDYIKQLAARHPASYEHIVQFDMQPGTKDALLAHGARDDPASKGIRTAGLDHLPVLEKGNTSQVHVKNEKGFTNYGLRKGSVDIFNDRITSHQTL